MPVPAVLDFPMTSHVVGDLLCREAVEVGARNVITYFLRRLSIRAHNLVFTPYQATNHRSALSDFLRTDTTPYAAYLRGEGLQTEPSSRLQHFR